MRPRRISQRREQPEKILQDQWVFWFEAHKWHVKVMHASARLSGLPDLYITHAEHGPRWVEIKLPRMIGSKFTPAQMETFPKFVQNGSPIWILTERTKREYKLLWSRPEGNLVDYMMLKL